MDPTQPDALTTYEFDMGMGLDLPNAAGDAILDNAVTTGHAETFKVGGVVFEFEHGQTVTAGKLADGNTAIPIFAGETTSQVAAQIATIVNGLKLTNLISGNSVAITADPYGNRVMLNGATGVTQSASPSITLEGNGSGKKTPGSVGYIPVSISSTDTAAQVASAIVAKVDSTMKVDGSLIHVVGHLPAYIPDPVTGINYVGLSDYTSNGLLPMPYSNSLPGDNDAANPTYPGLDRFTATVYDPQNQTIDSRAWDNAQ